MVLKNAIARARKPGRTERERERESRREQKRKKKEKKKKSGKKKSTLLISRQTLTFGVSSLSTAGGLQSQIMDSDLLSLTVKDTFKSRLNGQKEKDQRGRG